MDKLDPRPTGTSFRSLRRAFNLGWRPPSNLKVKPERKLLYLNSHARDMEALKRILAAR